MVAVFQCRAYRQACSQPYTKKTKTAYGRVVQSAHSRRPFACYEITWSRFTLYSSLSPCEIHSLIPSLLMHLGSDLSSPRGRPQTVYLYSNRGYPGWSKTQGRMIGSKRGVTVRSVPELRVHYVVRYHSTFVLTLPASEV